MLRTTLAIAAISALLVAAPATAAFAEEVEPSTPPTTTTPGYGPKESREPTLAGSTATGVCDGDVPWIKVDASLLDPDGASTSHTVHLVLTDGAGNSVDLTVGELGPDNKLSTTILWPGASVDEQGNATGWPGWALVNGELVQTDGNFAWTRGGISATLQVNPSLPVSLSYPPATSACANPKTTDAPGGAGTASVGGRGNWLAATGVDAAVVPIALGAGALALVGAGLLIGRRFAKR